MGQSKHERSQEPHPASQTPLVPPHELEHTIERTPLGVSVPQRARRAPRSLSLAEVQFLQRTIGNRAVAQLFQSTAQRSAAGTSPLAGMPPLTQADRSVAPSTLPPLQPKARGLDTLGGVLSQKEVPLQRVAESAHPKENTTGLPDTLKAGIETLSGMSMDDVSVHYNSSEPAKLQALAYTQGTEIHVGPGQEQHLAHEAWHVVQQKQRLVKSTLQVKGVAINDNEGLEREADRMSAKAVTGQLGEGLLDRLTQRPNETGSSSSKTGSQYFSSPLLPDRRVISAVAPFQRTDGTANSHVAQLQRPKSPQQLLAERLASAEEEQAPILDVYSTLPEGRQKEFDQLSNKDRKALALYYSAKDYRLGISIDRLANEYKPHADEALAQLIKALLTALTKTAGESDLDTAYEFVDELDEAIRQLNASGDDGKEKAADILSDHKQRVSGNPDPHVLAAEYMKHGEASAVDYGGFLSDKSLEKVPKQYDASKDATSLAWRLLRDTWKEESSHEKRLYIVARAIRDLKDLDIALAKMAAGILSDYLRTEVNAFVYAYDPGKDNGVNWSLFDDVKKVDASGNNPEDLPKDDPLNEVIREAWTTITKVVSPKVLQRVGRVKIRVHPDRFYRQYYSGGVIHVGTWRNSASVLLHEFGHHLEDLGNAPRWLRLHQMLHERAQGEELKSIFPITIPKVVSSEEKQYAVKMPAWWYAGGWFGYSARYYSSGSTEVVSTTMEVLNKQDRLFQIAVLDPELFLAVMGLLRD